MNSKSTSQKWWEAALDDLKWTEANIREEVWYGACFTAQQAVEKALKAYLLAQKVSVPKIHDISALLEACSQTHSEFSSHRDTILPLVDYYIHTRYPDMSEFMEYTKEKAEDALDRAEKLIEFMRSQLEQTSHPWSPFIHFVLLPLAFYLRYS